jgi:uncharacterized protein
MSVYYFDSSTLVKRYCYETGSLWVRHLVDPEQGNGIFTAHITGIEVVAAIARKARMREMLEPDATTAIRTFRHHFRDLSREWKSSEQFIRPQHQYRELSAQFALSGVDSLNNVQCL